MRKAALRRDTRETRISGSLAIEGRGRYEISTGIRFLDHMLELFAKHGGFDLKLRAEGDLDVDQHHTVEDVGIALGEAFDRALGDKRGILRAGYFLMPMDETLAIAAVDLSGRAAFARSIRPSCPAVLRCHSENGAPAPTRNLAVSRPASSLRNSRFVRIYRFVRIVRFVQTNRFVRIFCFAIGNTKIP